MCVEMERKSSSTFVFISEGVKVDVENMEGNITTTTTTLTEAIHDETNNNDGMKQEEEEKVEEIKADDEGEVEAIRTTMSIPTLLSLTLENINTSAAPEGMKHSTAKI